MVLLATGRPKACARCRSWAWRPSCGAGAWPVPVLLPGTGLTLTTASAPHSVLVTLVVVFVAAVLLVVPSFLLLFSLHGRQLLEEEKHAEKG